MPYHTWFCKICLLGCCPHSILSHIADAVKTLKALLKVRDDKIIPLSQLLKTRQCLSFSLLLFCPLIALHACTSIKLHRHLQLLSQEKRILASTWSAHSYILSPCTRNKIMEAFYPGNIRKGSNLIWYKKHYVQIFEVTILLLWIHFLFPVSGNKYCLSLSLSCARRNFLGRNVACVLKSAGRGGVCKKLRVSGCLPWDIVYSSTNKAILKHAAQAISCP
jgi:hypothetical protein